MREHNSAASRPVFWRDCLVALSITLTVLAVGAVLWLRAPSRGVVEHTAARRAKAPAAAAAVPEGFALAWSRPNRAASSPMVVGGTLITADGNTLTGWSIASGEPVWRHTELMPLCSATSAWGKVFAVYRGAKGCSLVLALEGDTGARPAELHADSRTGDGSLYPRVQLAPTVMAEGADRAAADGAESWSPHLILVMGASHLELWHENLLRSVEYGRVVTAFEPKKQPRPGCAIRSAAVGEDSFAVLERCRRDPALRLSFLKSMPKKDTEPEKPCAQDQECSAVLTALDPGDDAEVLGVVGQHAALYVPEAEGRPARIVEEDGRGDTIKSADLAVPVTARNSPPWRTSPTTITWWTGSAVVGISAESLAVQFQTPDLAGPATGMAGQLIAPTAAGLAVLDPATGAKIREIPMERASASNPGGARFAVSGSTVLRQQNGEVLAYSGR